MELLNYLTWANTHLFFKNTFSILNDFLISDVVTAVWCLKSITRHNHYDCTETEAENICKVFN